MARSWNTDTTSAGEDKEWQERSPLRWDAAESGGVELENKGNRDVKL